MGFFDSNWIRTHFSSILPSTPAGVRNHESQPTSTVYEDGIDKAGKQGPQAAVLNLALAPPSKKTADTTGPMLHAPGFTFGWELELHHFGLADVHVIDGQPTLVRPRKAPLFHSDFLNGVTDKVGGDAARGYRLDLHESGINMSYEFRGNSFSAYLEGRAPVNTLEINSSPFTMPNNSDEQLARKQLQAIDAHLRAYLSEHADNLVKVSDWIDAFNCDHPPELHIKKHHKLAETMHFIAGEESKEIRQRMALVYPQISYSTALEAWAVPGLLEGILVQDSEPALNKRLEHRSPHRAQLDLTKRLERRAAQLEIIQVSRESAAEATECLRRRHDPEKFHKLQGYFTLLGTLARTEASTTSLKSGGTDKNKYIMYIKHRITDIRDNCLSDRDRKVLKELPLAVREDLLKKLLHLPEDTSMFTTASGKEVSLGAFWRSALGFSNDDACNGLREVREAHAASTLDTQPEPGQVERKRPLDRVVVELRTLNDKPELPDVFEMLDRAMSEIPEVNRTPKMLKP